MASALIICTPVFLLVKKYMRTHRQTQRNAVPQATPLANQRPFPFSFTFTSIQEAMPTLPYYTH